MPKKSKKKEPSRQDHVLTSAKQPVRVDLIRLPVEQCSDKPLIWVDRMDVTVRTDIPIATLRFYSSLVNTLTEACRLQLTIEHLKKMAEVIYRVTDYYPQKPTT